MKNVNVAMTLNELKMKKVAMAIRRNWGMAKAAIVERAISPRLPTIELKLIGLKSDLFRVDLLFTKKAGIIARMEQGTATHMDTVLTPVSALGNKSGL